MDVWVPDSRFTRLDENRSNPSWVAAQWHDPEARLIGVDWRGRVLSNEEGTALRFLPIVGDYDPDLVWLVGLVDDRAIFAVETTDSGPSTSLRDLAVHLSHTERDFATTALALVNWHRVAPYCGVCGHPTNVIKAGHVRWCPECERERFPRTDPAVIAAILDADDRMLLGHQGAWTPGRVSVLAGFVESGESLEQAVRREVWEESRVRVGEIRYFGSQPHPYPRSLMLGFVGRAVETDIQVDGLEIEWARFFTRDDLRAALDAGEVTLPSRSSIAMQMVHAWMDGTLAAPEG